MIEMICTALKIISNKVINKYDDDDNNNNSSSSSSSSSSS